VTTNDAVISCRNVWKVFGDHPERLRLSPATTSEELRATDHIATVRDVSLDIRRGRC
jgi:glycine betaine/proline transport system ATP-binding protein